MADAKPKEKSKALLTPMFRVSFPAVWQMQSYNNGTPRYSVAGLFYPPDFSDDDKAKWKAIRAALDVVSIEGFKKPMKDLPPGAFKTPYHRGDEKEYESYGDPKMVFFTMANSKRRPQIIDRNGEPITSDNADQFYAGCYARASVRPYWFNNIGKGLAIGLCNLQKIKDGKSFEGFTTAEDDFGGDAAEFGDAGDEDLGLGGDAGDDDDPTA